MIVFLPRGISARAKQHRARELDSSHSTLPPMLKPPQATIAKPTFQQQLFVSLRPTVIWRGP